MKITPFCTPQAIMTADRICGAAALASAAREEATAAWKAFARPSPQLLNLTCENVMSPSDCPAQLFGEMVSSPLMARSSASISA